MGEVWQATDLVIGRTVAIKILKDEYLGDPGFLERFRAEARHAALVNHEGIANVFDYGEEDGSAYLVMELVPGEALSAILERERVLSTDRVLDIVAQTANALSAAHAAGLVHRDIKPGNLLITPDGRVKITDFGIARIADQVPLTATGQVMGTVQYLSPEQASGRSASPTTDIYSLGIVAYESLAGRRPFTGESQVAIAMAQINETPPELPITISEPVRNLVYACIAKNPADRPSSAAHLARAAQALRRGDISAAAQAVPGILGAGSLAATAGANYGQNTAMATQLLSPPTAATAAPAEEEPQRRNPWLWPLIAIVSVLAVILVVVIVALVLPPADEEATPTPTVSQSASPTPSATPSASPTPSPTPTVDAIVINEDDFLGISVETARRNIEGLGLRMTEVPGDPAPDSTQVGLSYAVSPTGPVEPNQMISVTFYTAVPTAPQPSAVTGDATGVSGETATVQWSTYAGCPSGFTLTGYSFTLTNATVSSSANPVLGPDATSLTIRLGTAGTPATVSYMVSCGELQSPVSPAFSIAVTE
ncbi:serine/threonine-protein kinase [Conyzicola lurida]|uniref:non-specific serine/threonine protein kinase n=2 Tax=Conyzicola lurida TaxID=1172621 RepID=A0A841ATL7_9MICO|nr:serine/threonine-protein kinase [Conyzicola lurida]